MKKIPVVIATTAIALSSTAFAFNSPNAYEYKYRVDNGRTYSICTDNRGYVVYKPGGGMDTYGSDHVLSSVKERYGIPSKQRHIAERIHHSGRCPR